jgi:hypothetical protein
MARSLHVYNLFCTPGVCIQFTGLFIGRHWSLHRLSYPFLIYVLCLAVVELVSVLDMDRLFTISKANNQSYKWLIYRNERILNHIQYYNDLSSTDSSIVSSYLCCRINYMLASFTFIRIILLPLSLYVIYV